jgi:hypothetical protein
MFPKLNEINIAGVTCSAGGVLCYNEKPLIVQTGLILCPYGISDANKLRFQLSEAALGKLEKLDELVDSLAMKQGKDHIKIINDGWLNLTIGPWTRFFDNNKALIDAQEGILFSEFTASLLIDLSKVTMFDENMMLSAKINQVLVRTYSQLPRGCEIFTDVAQLRLAQSSGTSGSIPHVEEGEGVEEEEDLNVNELLD